jgi:hypothetical protein
MSPPEASLSSSFSWCKLSWLIESRAAFHDGLDPHSRRTIPRNVARVLEGSMLLSWLYFLLRFQDLDILCCHQIGALRYLCFSSSAPGWHPLSVLSAHLALSVPRCHFVAHAPISHHSEIQRWCRSHHLCIS